MDLKLYRIEITLLNPEGQILADFGTSDTDQKRFTALFNELTRIVVDGSDENWEKNS